MSYVVTDLTVGLNNVLRLTSAIKYINSCGRAVGNRFDFVPSENGNRKYLPFRCHLGCAFAVKRSDSNSVTGICATDNQTLTTGSILDKTLYISTSTQYVFPVLLHFINAILRHRRIEDEA